jgi:DNA polymerase/3'-5' exonuclease PolX
MIRQAEDFIPILKSLVTIYYLEDNKEIAKNYETAIGLLYQSPKITLSLLEELIGIKDEVRQSLIAIYHEGTCKPYQDYLPKWGYLLPLTTVKGIGPTKAKLLANKGITDLDTVKQLVQEQHASGKSLTKVIDDYLKK